MARYDVLLPTMGVGSYATPGWLFPFREAMASGRVGPDDVDEAFEDATRIVIDDQVKAGIDIICDGELQRQRFVYEMYDRLSGLERIPATRRLGVSGYDRAPKFVANEPIVAANGLGLLDEYKALARLAPRRHLKIAFPGPLTFAQNIMPGDHYGDDDAAHARLLQDIVAILKAETEALIGAGAELVQIDEPGLTSQPDGFDQDAAAAAINDVIAEHADRTAVHICFGNNASRPFAPRNMTRLMPSIRALRSSMLLLEFANREMSEVELLGDLSKAFEIAAGVIDVKSFHVETAQDVEKRLRQVMQYVPVERLLVTADCGFSAIPRWLARQKLVAMVEGTKRVRMGL